MKGSVQKRFVFAMLAMVALTVVAFGAVVWVANDRVEAALLDTLINRETDFLSQQIVQTSVVNLPESSQVSAWFSRNGHGHVPSAFDQLPLGTTHDVAFQRDLYHVQRRAVNNGVLTVAIEITAMETREHQFQFAIVVGGFAVVVVSLCVGIWLSLHVAKPIRLLSTELQLLPPEELDRRFAPRYHEADTHMIALAIDRFMERVRKMLDRERGFAAAASHEIRSPLTVIRGALELALLDEALSSSSQRSLARAQRSVENLGFVMDSLLELARQEKPTDSEVGLLDAGPLVTETIETMSQVSQAYQDRLIWTAPDQPVCLSVSEGAWSVIVRNLIANALQHAGYAKVELQLDPHCFSVRDFGAGVDPAMLQQIFTQGRRSDSSVGAGLGLYIADQLAQRQGWKIEVKNMQPGSLFQVIFDSQERAVSV